MPFWRALTGLALAFLVAACATVQHSAPAAYSAMTFNIRLDLASDGENAWPHRREIVAQLIAEEAPDVLGLQEVLLHQRDYLQAALPDYTFLGVARDDGKEAGEFSSLAFRTDRFELLDSGTFWLSETPAIPSKGWDAALPRIATWALLRDRASGARLRVLNTHFDHVGQLARANAARQIMAWVATGDAAGTPTIVMGDFNVSPDSEPYGVLASASGPLRDSRLASVTAPRGPSGTFTGFRTDRPATGPIDHIFVTGQWRVAGHSVIDLTRDGRLPSDHYPVRADLLLEQR